MDHVGVDDPGGRDSQAHETYISEYATIPFDVHLGAMLHFLGLWRNHQVGSTLMLSSSSANA